MGPHFNVRSINDTSYLFTTYTHSSALLALIIYFIAGILFMYFVKGARGLEMIPNINFWKSLPLLIAVTTNHTTCHMTCSLLFLYRKDACLLSARVAKNLANTSTKKYSVIIWCICVCGNNKEQFKFLNQGSLGTFLCILLLLLLKYNVSFLVF